VSIAVAATRGTSWETRAAVLCTRSAGWSTLAGASAAHVAIWRVRDTDPVQMQRGALWAVLAPVSSQRAAVWRTLAELTAVTYRSSAGVTPRERSGTVYRG
jgi:hypothetical protein